MASDAGPFYFAWVDSGSVPFGVEHLVEDEEIVRFVLEQQEGEFAKLTIDVRNPRIGPLAPGRPVWAWFSMALDSDAVPLFLGRIVGVPENILGEIITYNLIARPADYPELKAALADSLRVLPFYDPIFIDEQQRSDPDTVLEGYSGMWHIDRTTHEVSLSDFLIGDEVIEFDGTTVPFDSVSISMGALPITKVTVKGQIPWTQSANNTFSFGRIHLLSADASATAANWPKAGDSLAGGYYVVAATAEGLAPAGMFNYNYSWENQQDEHRDNDMMTFSESISRPINLPLAGTPFGDIEQSFSSQFQKADKETGTPERYSENRQGVLCDFGHFNGTLTIGIDADRDMREDVELVLTSDLQPVLRDPDDPGDEEIIDLNSVDVADECQEDIMLVESDALSDALSDSGLPPLEIKGRAEYITTDRGAGSIGYMIARARARLLLAARCVDISFDCAISDAVNLSCRKNVLLSDGRIPGGEALGKVVAYSMRGDGTTGEFRGNVRMACAAGNGNSIATSPGEADYVNPEYVDDYQTFTGQVVAMPSGDVGYSPPVLVAGGGNLAFPLTRDQVVLRAEIKNKEADVSELARQSADINIDITIKKEDRGEAHFDSVNEYAAKMAQAMASAQQWFELELLDLTQEAVSAHYQINTTALVVPKQIDLTAAASV